jgi:hypothetical protein
MVKPRYTPENPSGSDNYIFQTWVTTKDGRRIYARDYGLKAFRIDRDRGTPRGAAPPTAAGW